MNTTDLDRFIEARWQADVMPSLIDYIAIPALSPAFDPLWEENGHIEAAVQLVLRWVRRSPSPASAACRQSKAPPP